jgi:hypothetical protein
MRLSLLTACLMTVLETASPSFAARIGDLNVGGSSYFEYDAASASLVQVVNGEMRIWQTPPQGSLLQIDYSYEVPPILDAEQPLLRPEWFPIGLTSQGAIYRGNPETRSWQLIGQVPERDSNYAGSSKELFASYPLMEKLLFWAGPNAVWYSADLAKSWHKLKDLPDSPKRLLVSRDLDLVVFTEAGLAIDGKLKFASEERLTWNPEIEVLPVRRDDDVLYGGPGQYTIVSASRAEGARSWRARHGFEPAEAVPGRSTEASVRNVNNRACKWSVISRTPSRGWSDDNYWDFPWTRTEIDLEYKLLSGDSRNCKWEAPFRAMRFEIRKSDNSKQVFGGGPGNYRFIAYENPSTQGVVRAFALHVEDASKYPKYGRELKVQTGDLWAVLVQPGIWSGQSACEVFREAQRQSSNRSTLTVPIQGGNSSCRQARSTAIACVSQDARSAARTAGMPAAVENVFQPRAASGSGECLLPDLP